MADIYGSWMPADDRRFADERCPPQKRRASFVQLLRMTYPSDGELLTGRQFG
jgi:hypothetical protein